MSQGTTINGKTAADRNVAVRVDEDGKVYIVGGGNVLIVAGTFNPQGVYDNATNYNIGDVVSYEGSSYIMYVDGVAGTLPTDTDYWQVIAEGGSAANITFDDSTVSAASSGTITGDDVQEILDTLVTVFATNVGGLYATLAELNEEVDALGSAGLQPELRQLEDRSKYALVGGGSLANYDSLAFQLPSQGDLDGFDSYHEYVPLWGFSNDSGYADTFCELFTITDEAAWGGDLIETALVWRGSRALTFFELSSDESIGSVPNGYGEDPVMLPDNYSGTRFDLMRTRYTHDPINGVSRIWRPARQDETPDGTAFGIDWMIVSESDKGGAWAIQTGNTNPWKIGVGGGKTLISRIIVNDFDGTPRADFDPVANTVNATTVYDPIADENWTSEGVGVVIDTTTFVEAWLKGVNEISKMTLIGTYSFGSDSINFYGGASGVDIDSYSATNGDVLRIRTSGTKDFGSGNITLAVGDFLIYDFDEWKVLYKAGGGGSGVVETVVSGTGIDVDATDPANPEISIDAATIASLALADSAVQDLADLGITATASELNILDGVTATAAELNKLDGVTADTAEINKLDGLTPTTAELNHVDGVTSAIQTQLDAKAGLLATAGRSSNTTDTISVTVSTYQAVDTTNLRVTFNAPASGRVLVRLHGSMYNGAGSGSPTIWWGLLNGSTLVDGVAADNNPATTFVRQQTNTFIISGLTPGASYTWDLAVSSSDHTLRPAIFRTSSALRALMEVWAT